MYFPMTFLHFNGFARILFLQVAIRHAKALEKPRAEHLALQFAHEEPSMTFMKYPFASQ